MEKKIFYTNQILLAIQPMDFTMLLNVTSPDGSVENQAMVYLSPQHAKGLLNVLAENVKNYEELFGVINLEPNVDKVRELESKGLIRVSKGDPQ